MGYKDGYKLFEDTYLCIFDECLAIVKVNKDGEMGKVTTFGEKQKGETTMTAREIIEAGLYNAAVNLMDDELREELHREISPCSELEFLAAYMERHAEKYGCEFVI